MAAKTRKNLCASLQRWLEEHYPTAYPVEVKWVAKIPVEKEDEESYTARERERGYYGYCVRDGKKYVIKLSLRRCRTLAEATETLMHEWAHALTWGLEAQNKHRKSDHDDPYWLEYGRIYRHYVEGDGYDEVRKAC